MQFLAAIATHCEQGNVRGGTDVLLVKRHDYLIESIAERAQQVFNGLVLPIAVSNLTL